MSGRGQAALAATTDADALERRPAQGDEARLTSLAPEVALGACLLFLFLVALAWDPFDRRFGFRARRRAERLREAGGFVDGDDGPEMPASARAYAIGPVEADGD